MSTQGHKREDERIELSLTRYDAERLSDVVESRSGYLASTYKDRVQKAIQAALNPPDSNG